MKNMHKLSVFFLASFVGIFSYAMENQEKYVVLDQHTHTALSKLTIYKKDLYFERLLQKGLISLDDLAVIHEEIVNGLQSDPELATRDEEDEPNRWEYALKIAPRPISEKTLKRLTERNKLIVITGQYGIGKQTLACAIAYKLGLRQMRVPATSLIGETVRGTSMNVRHLIENCFSSKNTALIIDDLHYLISDDSNKRVDPEEVVSFIKSGLNGLRFKEKTSSLIICTSQHSVSPLTKNINGVYQIRLNLPDVDQRFEILNLMINDKKAIINNAVSNLLKCMSEQLEDFTPLKLQWFINCAMLDAERVDGCRPVILERSLKYAYRRITEQAWPY